MNEDSYFLRLLSADLHGNGDRKGESFEILYSFDMLVPILSEKSSELNSAWALYLYFTWL